MFIDNMIIFSILIWLFIYFLTHFFFKEDVMKAILCLFVLLVGVVSQAAADFDVSVDSNLTDIALSAGDTTIVIPFKDGVATWVSKPDEGFFIGFYTEASLKKVAQAEKVYTIPAIGVKPNAGNIYLVIRGISEKDNTFYAWPVQFSPFGIGLHSTDGKVCHNGLALFGPHAIKTMIKNKKLF